LIAVLAAYLLRIRKDLKSGYPLEDERTEKLNGKAAMGTYYITVFFIVIELLWMIFSTEVPSPPEIDIRLYSIGGDDSHGRLFWNPQVDLRKKGSIDLKTRIKELRARYNVTQEDLARKVGVRRETILYLEKGKYNPSLLLAHNIAKTLKTTLPELFIFQEEQQQNMR
jgi:putative transcriptional regulator